MNRWHVYEYMKNRFMDTGVVPRESEVYIYFHKKAPLIEIARGISEFNKTIALPGI